MGKSKLPAWLQTPNGMIFLGLAIWWVVNLLQAGLSELANDEAYYYMFSQDLALGYFDHPPLTALLVRMGAIFPGELGVRFFFTLLQPIYLYALWRIVQPSDTETTRQDALLFLLISASMPILQLYGFIAVPDGPLMLFTALFLWSYQRFTRDNSWAATLWMGLCIGALAYSKYHGALVVFFTLLSNPKLLKNPRFYIASLLGIVVMLPHLWWQYEHQWVSFSYHLAGRNRDFQWAFVTEYILNLFAIFNPFLFPVFAVAWWKSRAQEPALRAMSCIAAGFILFFLASTFRGYVQPQWDIPATFGIIALVYGYVREREKWRRYTVRVAWVTIALIALVRVELAFNPLGVKFEVFNNRTSYGELADIAQGRPIIFSGGYTMAAKYLFYTGGTAYGQPTVHYRTSQYELKEEDTQMAGKEVIVEVRDTTLAGVQSVTLSNGRKFSYIVEPHFTPVRKVRIEHSPLPTTLHTGETVAVELSLRNPYPYAISLNGADTAIHVVFRRVGEPTQVVPLRDAIGRLPASSFEVPDKRGAAEGVLQIPAHFTVPELKPGKTYQVGFTVINSPNSSWFNGKPQEVLVQP